MKVSSYAWDLKNDNAVIKMMIGLLYSIFPIKMVAAE